MSNRLAVAAFVALAFSASAAFAAEARPPLGGWIGAFQDGSTVELYVQGNGTCAYGPTGSVPTVGTCSWHSSSPAGGILTITYFNAGFESHAYYSVVWAGPRSYTLSDPYFKVMMQPKQ